MFVRVIVLFVLWLPFNSYASEPLYLKVYTEEFPPYNFTENGEVVGINVEIVKQLCHQSGIDCEFELLPWTRAFQLTRSDNNSGLISTSRSKERENWFHWIGPLVSSKTFFYKLKSRDDILLTSISDASNFTVGIQRNDIYENLLTKNGFVKGENLLSFSAKHEDMDLFFKEKLDLILGSELTLPYQVDKYGYSSEKVIGVLEFDVPELKGNFLALNPDISPIILKRLQLSYKKIKSSGYIERIITKYKKMKE